jgi:hypothetical protein
VEGSRAESDGGSRFYCGKSELEVTVNSTARAGDVISEDHFAVVDS